MLDWTDKHCRVFHRCISKNALLYTEMITTGALLFGDKRRHLDFFESEHPVALQLGGSDPAALAECSALAEDWGYDEVNLNCGCPSARVQSGSFGACLMLEPALVAEMVHAMKNRTKLPVTVKHRIGVDEQEGGEFLWDFVEKVASAGADAVIVHARKAWLSGLSPKENREIPPLDYGQVQQIAVRLREDFPHCRISLNGGITELKTAEEALGWADGVMMGRAAYQTPFVLAEVDKRIFGAAEPSPTRGEIVARFEPHLAEQLQRGETLHRLTKSTLGLFAGCAGGRQFRRVLSSEGHGKDADLSVWTKALAHIPDEVLNAPSGSGDVVSVRPEVE